HVDCQYRLLKLRHRSGQRDVRRSYHRGRGDQLRPVPLPAAWRGLMATTRSQQTHGVRGGALPVAGRELAQRTQRKAVAGRRQSGGGVLYLAAGLGVSAVFVVPLLWEIFRSLQPETTVTQPPSAASFSHLTFANYQALLSGQDDIIRNVLNSLIVALLTAAVT